MNIPSNLKYTKDHEWILIDGKTGTIGITDYAQGELGDVVFIDIDPDQTGVAKGQSLGTIEAVKTVSDVFAPCSGNIIEVNKKLADNPEIVNSNPYDEGWMLKIEITNASELSDLLDAKDYQKLIGQ